MSKFTVIWFEGPVTYVGRKQAEFVSEQLARGFATEKIVLGYPTVVWWLSEPPSKWQVVTNFGPVPVNSAPLNPWPSERKQDEKVEP